MINLAKEKTTKLAIASMIASLFTDMAIGQGAVTYEVPAVTYQKIITPNSQNSSQPYQIVQANQGYNYQTPQQNYQQVAPQQQYQQVAPQQYQQQAQAYQPQAQQYQPVMQQPMLLPQQNAQSQPYQYTQPQMNQQVQQQQGNNRNLSQNYITSMQPTTTSSGRMYNYPTSTNQAYNQANANSYAANMNSGMGMMRKMSKRGGIYGQVGLSGLGVGLTYHINSFSNIRGEFNGGLSTITEKLIKEKSYGGVVLKPSAKVGDVGLFYDFFPASDSDMHFTAGLIQGRSEISLKSVNATSTTSALIKMPKTALYLGLGWGHSPLKTTNMTFFSEIGLILGKSEYSVSNGTTAISNDVKKLSDKLKFFPVYKMGVDYDFF